MKRRSVTFLYKETIVRNIHSVLLLLITGLLLPCATANAQSGGRSTYDFLSLTQSARIAAIGGNFLTVRDNDISLAAANPSLITPEMHQNLALGFVAYPGIKYGSVTYAHSFEKAGSFIGALQYVNYGKFQKYDEAENHLGEFSANEMALLIGWGRMLSPHFSIGANGKLIYSQLDTWNSFGIAVDVAGSYFTLDNSFSVSLIGRNIGTQIVPYTPGNYEPLPFELQIGLTQQLKHIPVRFYQLLTNLQRWDLSYTDPADPDNQADPITGEVEERSGLSKFADNLMRHIVLGGEVTIAKVLSLRLGYNYLKRQEMKLYTKSGLAGFSLGVGLRIKMFSVSYTYVKYQPGKYNPNYFTLAVNFQALVKK